MLPHSARRRQCGVESRATPGIARILRANSRASLSIPLVSARRMRAVPVRAAESRGGSLQSSGLAHGKGGLMIEFIALAAAIVLVLAVLMLRNIFAFPFARQRAMRVAAHAPAGTANLYEEATQALLPLGFEDIGWMAYQREDGEAALVPLRAVFRHVETGGIAVLAGPLMPKSPHQLVTVFCHKLADGRLAVSQPFDCYFEQTQTDEIIAQTLSVHGLAEQWQAHLAWMGKQGQPVFIGDDDLPDVLGDAYERQRQFLIGQGKLRVMNESLALPRLGFALRLLKGYLTMPKPAQDLRPVPPERLALLAVQMEHAQHRAPPRDVQWGLFGASVVLFMAAGAVFWGGGFALIVLGVVLFHELGHFLAMRAFGYRNTHILALPLVGGVAMGFDAKPDATRSAWMSLMGPLPGIVLGWVLLLVHMLGLSPAWMGEWSFYTALMLLVINYLNLLPMPPLDGAHVVQALLPPGWSRFRTVFIAVACVVGALASWWAGFVLLAVLAAFQLLGVPAQWRLHRVEDELRREPASPPQHRSVQLLRVFRTMEKFLGATPLAAVRVNQGLQLARSLETTPMNAVARIGIGTLYAGLLVVPVLAWFVWFGRL